MNSITTAMPNLFVMGRLILNFFCVISVISTQVAELSGELLRIKELKQVFRCKYMIEIL